MVFCFVSRATCVSFLTGWTSSREENMQVTIGVDTLRGPGEILFVGYEIIKHLTETERTGIIPVAYSDGNDEYLKLHGDTIDLWRRQKGCHPLLRFSHVRGMCSRVDVVVLCGAKETQVDSALTVVRAGKHALLTRPAALMKETLPILHQVHEEAERTGVLVGSCWLTEALYTEPSSHMAKKIVRACTKIAGRSFKPGLQRDLKTFADVLTVLTASTPFRASHSY